jgi:hypothetical protein
LSSRQRFPEESQSPHQSGSRKSFAGSLGREGTLRAWNTIPVADSISRICELDKWIAQTEKKNAHLRTSKVNGVPIQLFTQM